MNCEAKVNRLIRVEEWISLVISGKGEQTFYVRGSVRCRRPHRFDGGHLMIAACRLHHLEPSAKLLLTFTSVLAH